MSVVGSLLVATGQSASVLTINTLHGGWWDISLGTLPSNLFMPLSLGICRAPRPMVGGGRSTRKLG
jgi:hypothetical protein